MTDRVPTLCFWHGRQTGCECHAIVSAQPAPPLDFHTNAAGVEFVTVSCAACGFRHSHRSELEQPAPALDVLTLDEWKSVYAVMETEGFDEIAEKVRRARLGSAPSRSEPPDENVALLRRLDDWTDGQNAGPLIRWAAAHLRGCVGAPSRSDR